MLDSDVEAKTVGFMTENMPYTVHLGLIRSLGQNQVILSANNSQQVATSELTTLDLLKGTSVKHLNN